MLEGGAIDGDGTGLVVTTEQCLLNDKRNPSLDRTALEAALGDWLGSTKVIWLGNGLIEDLDTGRLYIGKKVMFFKGFKSVKKKRKRILKESDWREYYGSSDVLNEEVAKRGADRFKRTILHFGAVDYRADVWINGRVAGRNRGVSRRMAL